MILGTEFEINIFINRESDLQHISSFALLLAVITFATFNFFQDCEWERNSHKYI